MVWPVNPTAWWTPLIYCNHLRPRFPIALGAFGVRGVLTCLFFCALAGAPAALASSLEVFGFGARGMATAGSQTATALDYHAVFYNPSRILGSAESKFGIGTQLYLYDIQVDRALPTSPYATAYPKPNIGLHVGGSTPLGGFFKKRVALGFLFFTPLAHGTRIEQLDPRTPQAYIYQSLPDKMALLAGLAWKIAPWMQVGLGFQALASVSGGGKASVSLEQNRVMTRSMGVDFITNAAATAGLSFELPAATSIGLGYRGALGVPYKLPIELDLLEFGSLDFVARGTALWDPHIVDLGVSHNLSQSSLLVSAGVSWAMWSQAPAPNSIVELDFAQTRQDTETTAAPLLYVKSAPVDLGAQDIFIPRLGVEWKPSARWRLCAGYAFRPTPLPRATMAASYLDANTHIFGLGSAYTAGNPDDQETAPLTIDLAFQWHHFLPRKATKEDPESATGSLYFAGNAMALALELHHDF
jgi:long-subunit fatty acid transport protein